LTRREFLDFLVDEGQDLLALEAVLGAFDSCIVIRGFERFQRIEVFVVAAVERREQRDPRIADFLRRNQSWIAFCRIRWNSSGSSAAGLSPYFSASLIIASCTMSSDASSSRTAYAACLNARFDARQKVGEFLV
jgi:hypothetical protein